MKWHYFFFLRLKGHIVGRLSLPIPTVVTRINTHICSLWCVKMCCVVFIVFHRVYSIVMELLALIACDFQLKWSGKREIANDIYYFFLEFHYSLLIKSSIKNNKYFLIVPYRLSMVTMVIAVEPVCGTVYVKMIRLLVINCTVGIMAQQSPYLQMVNKYWKNIVRI